MHLRNIAFVVAIFGVIGGLLGYGGNGLVTEACKGAGLGMMFGLFVSFFLLSDSP